MEVSVPCFVLAFFSLLFLAYFWPYVLTFTERQREHPGRQSHEKFLIHVRLNDNLLKIEVTNPGFFGSQQTKRAHNSPKSTPALFLFISGGDRDFISGGDPPKFAFQSDEHYA